MASLPAGLAFDRPPASITGTPTAVTPAATFTWTAMDADGSTATLTFSITVEGGGTSRQ